MTFTRFDEPECLFRRSAEGFRCSAAGPRGCKEDEDVCWVDFEVQGRSQSSSRASMLDIPAWHGLVAWQWAFRLVSAAKPHSYKHPKLVLPTEYEALRAARMRGSKTEIA